MSSQNTNPYESNSYGDPPSAPPPLVGQHGDTDATGGLIPYKNPHALLAYYLGLFSIFPVLGLLLALPAVVLGVIGLRNRSRNPSIRGAVHAWIGIVMGGAMTIVWSLTLVLIAIATLTA